MRDVIAIVEQSIDLDQVAREIATEHVALQDCVRRREAADRQCSSIREEEKLRRLDLGRLLIRARSIPIANGGLRHGEWLPYLKNLGIAETSANRWIKEVEDLECKSPTNNSSGDSKPKSSNRRRTRHKPEGPDSAGASTDSDDDDDDIEDDTDNSHRPFDIEAALANLNNAIVDLASNAPEHRRKLAHELRQLADTIEEMK